MLLAGRKDAKYTFYVIAEIMLKTPTGKTLKGKSSEVTLLGHIYISDGDRQDGDAGLSLALLFIFMGRNL